MWAFIALSLSHSYSCIFFPLSHFNQFTSDAFVYVWVIFFLLFYIVVGSLLVFLLMLMLLLLCELITCHMPMVIIMCDDICKGNASKQEHSYRWQIHIESVWLSKWIDAMLLDFEIAMFIIISCASLQLYHCSIHFGHLYVACNVHFFLSFFFVFFAHWFHSFSPCFSFIHRTIVYWMWIEKWCMIFFVLFFFQSTLFFVYSRLSSKRDKLQL